MININQLPAEVFSERCWPKQSQNPPVHLLVGRQRAISGRRCILHEGADRLLVSIWAATGDVPATMA